MITVGDVERAGVRRRRASCSSSAWPRAARGNDDLNPLGDWAALLLNACIWVVSTRTAGTTLVADGVLSASSALNGLTIMGNASIRVNTTGTASTSRSPSPDSTAPGVRRLPAFARRRRRLHGDRRAGSGGAAGQLARPATSSSRRVPRSPRRCHQCRREATCSPLGPVSITVALGAAARPLERRGREALRGGLAGDPRRELRRDADALHHSPPPPVAASVAVGATTVTIRLWPAGPYSASRDCDHADRARCETLTGDFSVERATLCRRRHRDRDRRALRTSRSPCPLSGVVRHRDHRRRGRAARHRRRRGGRAAGVVGGDLPQAFLVTASRSRCSSNNTNAPVAETLTLGAETSR